MEEWVGSAEDTCAKLEQHGEQAARLCIAFAHGLCSADKKLGIKIEHTSRSWIRAVFWEGDATKHFSVKKGFFSEKGGGNSVNQGLGKDFYRKGNSVTRFGPFTEAPDSEN